MPKWPEYVCVPLEKAYCIQSVMETSMESPGRAAVLGAGTMGSGIAAALAAAGIPTSLWARRPDAARAAVKDATAKVEFLISSGLATAEPAPISADFELDSALEAVDIV